MDLKGKLKIGITKGSQTSYFRCKESGEKERTLLNELNKVRVPINQSCGGMGSCGTCRVWVNSSPKFLSKRTEIEQEMANDRGFSVEERLACQLLMTSDIEIKIP